MSMKFKVKFKDENSPGFGYVYAVRDRGDDTEFLICRYGHWEWRNMSEFVPASNFKW